MEEKSKYRRVVNREPFSTTVNLNYNNLLSELSEKTRIAKSKLTDEALELLFEKYNIDYKNESTEKK
ncbi:ribbon-helix-helix domain-containing protein [Clostridium beijerinckii]|jgi:hypothetical protein|uniref:Ribbon-helix-helix domain-containing protein n=2 Tax=Clostridium beijerinckii TaxID=1520 RepID=A0AAE2RX96_CLOBE|nr:ribbon-helix-helix domain-containing protein [Clostridium beijerinckii]ABR33527.1 hypothetical protein Cbei_1347 [Clostridium beijerinckii NCIMB 8052]AIU04848.1 hypothetical protein Cbs_1347 [Clostridium beijerinckii ATCC 35702]MBF7811570.1 ribbon-helix-helix domain-containing protein [Clostridium beijerinckii]MBF7811923.1 ribbon-helix-helix domain-containing protein [Clostridium beijerinckii]MBF7811939.1 ribbon-helix-helix domain-containing protein [Clostridium beijerinckii]